MIRRPPRSTQGVSSAASDVYKRQGPKLLAIYAKMMTELLQKTGYDADEAQKIVDDTLQFDRLIVPWVKSAEESADYLSLIHISEPTRRYAISYAVFCLKKKKTIHNTMSRAHCLDNFNTV